MRYLLTGIFLSGAAVLACLAVWGIDKVAIATGGIGLVCLALAMITSGSLVSGDRMRANYANESMSERHERTAVSTRLILIGLPNLVVAACFLYFL